jgi:hypothetical protein
VRLRVGEFRLRDAIGLDELLRTGRGAILSADEVLLALPAVVLGQLELAHLQHGRTWRSSVHVDGEARAYGADGRLVGLLIGHEYVWRPALSFLD